VVEAARWWGAFGATIRSYKLASSGGEALAVISAWFLA
jgi:hypothetical protein